LNQILTYLLAKGSNLLSPESVLPSKREHRIRKNLMEQFF